MLSSDDLAAALAAAKPQVRSTTLVRPVPPAVTGARLFMCVLFVALLCLDRSRSETRSPVMRRCCHPRYALSTLPLRVS